MVPERLIHDDPPEHPLHRMCHVLADVSPIEHELDPHDETASALGHATRRDDGGAGAKELEVGTDALRARRSDAREGRPRR